MPRRRSLLVVVATAGLGLSGTAQAATLTTPEACVRYVAGQPTFPVVATGFTPNTVIRIAAGSTALGSGVTDVAGAFTDALIAPAPGGGRVHETVTVAAVDAAGVSAPPIQVAVVRFVVRLPARARPARRVAFRAFGFPDGEAVHLHVRRAGRTLGSYRIGTAAAPCGTATRRLRYMPLRRYRTGSYDYVFTTSARYDPAAQPAIRLRILITRTLPPR